MLFDVNMPFDSRMSEEEVKEYLRREFARVNPKICLRIRVDHYTRA